MYRLPKDLDLSFFAGKMLNIVSFSTNTLWFKFDGKIEITVWSCYQQQQKMDVEKNQLGTVQSVYQLTASWLMQLVGHSVVTASADEEGTLILTFDHGQVLRCLNDQPAYECYSFTDGEHEYVV
jgi:hypothetical protein